MAKIQKLISAIRFIKWILLLASVWWPFLIAQWTVVLAHFIQLMAQADPDVKPFDNADLFANLNTLLNMFSPLIIMTLLWLTQWPEKQIAKKAAKKSSHEHPHLLD